MNTSRHKAKAVAALVLVVLSACTTDETTRDDSGSIIDSGTIALGSLREGDCVNLPASFDEVSSFEGVDCDAPHDGQVLGLFELDDSGGFPGADVVVDEGEDRCVEQFESFVGVSYADSALFIEVFVPTEESWEMLDDRGVICVVVPEEGEAQITGDLRGSNR